MSVKRMITKLALAFAAKKGMEAFRSAGGVNGVKDLLAGRTALDQHATQGHGRVGGTLRSDTGGLGNLLGSLGYGGATNGREAGVSGQMDASLAGLFGTLSSVIGGRTPAAESSETIEKHVSDANVRSEGDARAVLRAMVHMARADGEIDGQEHDAILEILHDASDSEREALTSALQEPVDARQVASDTPQHVRKEVYSAALLVGEPTNPAEREFLSKLADHLGLSHADVNDLHSAMNKAAA